MAFRYQWWGKGDWEASLGVFFDGFSKILSAAGIMLFVFGMPADIVLGKIIPGIGLAVCAGNLWYFYEARQLARKEQRQNVTAQPFGIGASQLTGWLYLIMGPAYWQTGDAELAFQVGLAAAFIGGFVEILGAFIGRWILRVIPQSALLGNMASSAIVWLTFVGIVMVFDKPLYAVLPLFIVIIDYLGKADRRFNKVPSGIVAVVLGMALAWAGGYLTWPGVTSACADVGLYLPRPAVGDLVQGMRHIVPFLPVILPLQINNFLSTLQGLQAAKMAGDAYPERRSMVMDGLSSVLGSLFGSPFPTTVYFGHGGWKELGARAGFSIFNAAAYLIICFSGLTGVLMALIPVEAVMVLLIFVGFSVTAATLRDSGHRYDHVILISLIPILFQYVLTVVSGAVQAAGTTLDALSAEAFAEFSVPIRGIQYLGNGAFLSSLLFAALLAYVVDKHYYRAAGVAAVLAGCSFIGMIHCEQVSLFAPEGVVFGAVYLVVVALLAAKGRFYHKCNTNICGIVQTEITNAGRKPS